MPPKRKRAEAMPAAPSSAKRSRGAEPAELVDDTAAQPHDSESLTALKDQPQSIIEGNDSDDDGSDSEQSSGQSSEDSDDEEDSEGEEGSGEEGSGEERRGKQRRGGDLSPPPRKVLPQRSTRGVRVNRLAGEAAEADEAFWGQTAFDEDGSDDDYSSDSEDTATTNTDSDIDMPEPEEDEARQAAAASEKAAAMRDIIDAEDLKKTKGVYVDKQAGATKGFDMKSMIANVLAKKAAKPTAPRTQLTAATTEDALQDFGAGGAPAGRSLRAKTAERSAEAESRRVATDAAAKKAAGDKDKVKAAPEPKPTQAQVLVEAAHTTIENERVLASMLRIESERQAKDALELGAGKGHSFPPGLPIVRFHSRRGYPDTLTFTEVDIFPPIVNAEKAAEYPKPQLCVVTGKRAEYRHPVTNLPYVDRSAYKLIQQRLEASRKSGALPVQGTPV